MVLTDSDDDADEGGAPLGLSQKHAFYAKRYEDSVARRQGGAGGHDNSDLIAGATNNLGNYAPGFNPPSGGAGLSSDVARMKTDPRLPIREGGSSQISKGRTIKDYEPFVLKTAGDADEEQDKLRSVKTAMVYGGVSKTC